MGRRSLTGAWIETDLPAPASPTTKVAPSRERGSKPASSPACTSCPRVAPSRERGSKPTRPASGLPRWLVAPSRERGSKPSTTALNEYGWLSLPHGSVDRNRSWADLERAAESRSLTGAWIETRAWRPDPMVTGVAPSRERGSKRRRSARQGGSLPVAPSRERGSKPPSPRHAPAPWRRSLTGAWIETGLGSGRSSCPPSRSLTGAWIETSPCREGR